MALNSIFKEINRNRLENGDLGARSHPAKLYCLCICSWKRESQINMALIKFRPRWYTPLILGDKGKQISKFKASLGQSKFQVKKSLSPGIVVHNLIPTFLPRAMWISEFKVNLQNKFQDSQAQAVKELENKAGKNIIEQGGWACSSPIKQQNLAALAMWFWLQSQEQKGLLGQLMLVNWS